MNGEFASDGWPMMTVTAPETKAGHVYIRMLSGKQLETAKPLLDKADVGAYFEIGAMVLCDETGTRNYQDGDSQKVANQPWPLIQRAVDAVLKFSGLGGDKSEANDLEKNLEPTPSGSSPSV